MDIFGSAEWALRLPNVLSFILYAWGGYRIFLRSRYSPLMFLAALCLLINPFVIEFFSLARGYGLALGCGVFASSFFFNLIAKSEHLKINPLPSLMGLLFFSGLAVYANLSWINLSLALWMVVVLYVLFTFKTNHQVLIWTGLLSLLFVSALYPAFQHLFLLKETGHLFFGSTSLIDAFDSFTNNVIYWSHWPLEATVWINSAGIFVYLISLIRLFLRWRYMDTQNWVTLWLTLVLLALVFEHLLFDALFPKGRTGLFLWPLVVFLFFFSLQSWLPQSDRFKRILTFGLMVLGLGWGLNFMVALNLKTTRTWDYDQDVKEAMLVIRDQLGPAVDMKTISNNWLHTPAINFYIISWKLPLQLTDRKGVKQESDFIFYTDWKGDLPHHQRLRVFENYPSELWVRKAE